MRQADKTRRIDLIQMRANRNADASLEMANPGNAALWLRGLQGDLSLSEVEYAQFMWLFAARMIRFEAAFLEHEARAIDEDAFEPNTRAGHSLLSTPGGQAMWKVVKPSYHRRFAAWTELQYPMTRGTIRGGQAGWKADIAARAGDRGLVQEGGEAR